MEKISSIFVVIIILSFPCIQQSHQNQDMFYFLFLFAVLATTFIDILNET